MYVTLRGFDIYSLLIILIGRILRFESNLAYGNFIQTESNAYVIYPAGNESVVLSKY